MSEQAVTQHSSSVKLLSPSQREVHRIAAALRDCALHSGVGVFHNILFNPWELAEIYLSAVDYKIFPNFPFHHHHTTLFTAIAQSIAYPKPPAAAESSDSFVIAVFVSGYVEDSAHTFDTGYGSLDIVDDIIKPFLPRSAPHLQHIPKVFFISAKGFRRAPPPHFPDDPDGNYCVTYHVTNEPSYMDKWAHHISDHLFLQTPGMSVQQVIENSRSHLNEVKEHLHYFTCLKNKIVLKNIL